MATILLIKHTSVECTVEQVKSVFNSLFEEDIVTKVTMSRKYDHKTFGIHFDKSNDLLDNFVKHIGIYKIQHVNYDLDFYSKRFLWHVTQLDPNRKEYQTRVDWRTCGKIRYNTLLRDACWKYHLYLIFNTRPVFHNYYEFEQLYFEKIGTTKHSV